MLTGSARTGAVSVFVECNNNGISDTFDCITAYYAGQYGTDFLGTYYGLGYVSNFTEFIAGPFSRNSRTADSLTEVYLIKRQLDTNSHQRGVYDFDPTNRIEWDHARGICPATTLEVDGALNTISQQFRHDSCLYQRGTLLHWADIYEDWTCLPRHTLCGEYTLRQSTAYHEAGIWHSIWGSTFSRLYLKGSVDHTTGITLFLFARGIHVGSALYNIQRNR